MTKIKTKQKKLSQNVSENKQISSKNEPENELVPESFMNPAIGDVEEYKSFMNSVHETFSPKSDLEMFFVNRAINCMWRLKRVANIEEAIFNGSIDSTKGNVIEQIFDYMKDKLMLINKYEKSVESSLYKTLRELKKIKEI